MVRVVMGNLQQANQIPPMLNDLSITRFCFTVFTKNRLMVLSLAVNSTIATKLLK